MGIISLDGDLRVRQINHAAQSMLRVSLINPGAPLRRLGKLGKHLSKLADRATSEARPVYEREHPLGKSEIIDIFCAPGLSPNACLIEIIPVQWHTQAAALREAKNRDLGLSMMLRGIAHEIRNPLSGIKGATQLLARDADVGNAEYCDIILKEITRLNLLLDQLGDYATPRREEPLNIHQVTERVVTLAQIEGSARIVRDYDPSLPDIIGDSDALIQAVLNLVRNAMQAGSGTVTIRTRIVLRELEESVAARHWIVVSVIDDGKGVPEDLRDVIFFPMVSGEERGSGLGLSITERIARGHGGRIDLAPTEVGAHFNLWLPLDRTV